MTMIPFPNPKQGDIFHHEDDDFSLQMSDVLMRRVMDRVAGFLNVVGDDQHRAHELMSRPGRQLQYIDHMRLDHGVTYADAAAGAKVSISTARRLRDSALHDSILSIRLDLQGDERRLTNLLWGR